MLGQGPKPNLAADYAKNSIESARVDFIYMEDYYINFYYAKISMN